MKTKESFGLAHARKPHQRLLSLVFAVAALTGFPTAYAVSEPSALNGEKQSYAYSWQDEVKQGAEADKEIVAQMGLYDNPQVQAYVQSVGQRVLASSTFANANTPEMYRGTKFTFRVLDSPVVNAFALPGGYVYVTRGLLAHADNEAQLAVVLGHEIAHVAARHSSQQARRSQWSQIGVIAGAILGQAVLGDRAPNIAENVLNTGSQALQVFLLRYSREAEHEADTFGVEYASRAGYAAGDSARFFNSLRRLREEEGKTLPTWMSSHPDPGDRAGRVVQLASAQSGGQPRTLGYDEYMRNIEGIVVGEDPRQGFTQNGVFYHPTLHFQMPVAQGWKVDNQPTAVIMAEPNNRALMGLRLAQGARTRDAATQFVSSNKVQVTGSGDTTINGLPATVVVGRAATEQGEVGVWNAFIELNGKVYSLLGYSPTQVFEQMRPTFESVAGGFGPLRDMRFTNVQPARLRVVRADRAAPFTSFIPTSLPPNMTAESVAVMNQVSLDGNVPAGAPIKIPDTSMSVASNAYSNTAYPQQQGTYPSSQPTYPNTSYPSQQQTYPQSPPYPQSSPYPQGSTTYPQSSPYPQGTTYPQTSPYPQGTTYPQGSPYPQSSTTYPQGSTPSWPNTTSPQPSQYPQQGRYPQQSPYPQSSGQYPTQQSPYPQSYPQTGYPQSPYPQTSYPQTSSPQYPQTTYPQYPQQQSAPPAGTSTGTTPRWP